MMKRIGIFAGTFDPVHDGHLAFAMAALEQGLEKVMFLVEPRPRRKQGVRALEHRIAMVQLAIRDNPRLGAIVLEQARFTVNETLPVLEARFKGYQLVLLFGDDVVAHIASWPHVASLMDVAELLIASRQADNAHLQDTLKTLQQTRNLSLRYDIIHISYNGLASSKIRLAMKHREPVVGLADAVKDYIHSHRLYRPHGN